MFSLNLTLRVVESHVVFSKDNKIDRNLIANLMIIDLWSTLLAVDMTSREVIHEQFFIKEISLLVRYLSFMSDEKLLEDQKNPNHPQIVINHDYIVTSL